MIDQYLALIIAVVGLLIYLWIGSGSAAVAGPGSRFCPCIAEAGKLAFAVGLLAFLLTQK